MKGMQGGDQMIAAAAYLPLFGWIYPLNFRKEDDLCQFHGRQGMLLNLAMVAVYFVIWVLENFPLSAWAFGPTHFLNPISQSVWIISAIAYFGVSIFGALKALAEEKWAIPRLEETMDRILSQVRGQR